jgi:hypothetical protein
VPKSDEGGGTAEAPPRRRSNTATLLPRVFFSLNLSTFSNFPRGYSTTQT